MPRRGLPAIIAAVLLAGSAPVSADDVPLPAAPPGFKVTLLARDPRIFHPTAVTAAPGGVVFAAEEYWNAKRPGAPETAVIKRLVDTDGDGVADDVKTFWAKGLRSVQGMRWFEGTLYCMHAPLLTAIRDTDGDGVGDEAKDIVAGEKPDSRHRIAGHLLSGVREWIDGRLYITCGDEGWWRAKTPEGREFEIHGGGILRCNPDGTGLEPYCTGLRNPYSTMAIDADGRGFTLDNTNDGQFVRFPGDLAWNERFTQIFHFGFYGYPYHFKNYPEECLPCLADYGGGSPSGGVWYGEDRFPEEYRGCIFFDDWGRRLVSRIRLTPDGVVHKPERTDFLTGGSGGGYEFRPTGIDVDENGNLVVCDWSMGGWGDGTGHGRIFRVTYAGKDGNGVTPPLPAQKKSIDGWAADLASPRFKVRFAAQRELERAGAAAAPKLVEVVKDGSVDSRIHAMWALARVAKEKAVAALVPLLDSPEERIRLHAARILGDAGVGAGGVDALIAHVPTDRLKDRIECAIALGALGASRAAPALLRAAAHDDVYVHHCVAYALRATGETEKTIAALNDADARVRDAALIALRERYDPAIVLALVRAAKSHPDAAFRARALRALVRVGRKPVAWDGEYWSFWPDTNAYPFGSVAWEGTPKVSAAAAELLKDTSRDIRLEAATGLKAVADESAGAPLADALGRETDDAVLAAIMAALEQSKSPRAYAGLAALVKNASKPATTRLRALVVAGSLKDLPPADVAARETLTQTFLKGLASGGADAKIGALHALSEAKASFASSWIREQLGDRETRVREAAVRSLGALGDAKALEAVKGLLADKAPEVRRAAAAAFAALTPKDADVSPLQPLLTDADPGVAREALTALLQKHGGAAKAVTEAVFAPFVRSWMVIGPFPNVDGKGWDAAYPPEQEIVLSRDYDGDGGRVRWKPVTSDGHELWLNIHIADRNDIAGYAAAVVQSPDAREVLFLTGSDDGLKVWVNGELVQRKNGSRAVAKDDDIFRVRLRSGSNTVLCKVVNAGGPWGMCLRIADPAGARALAFPPPAEGLAETRKSKLAELAKRGGDPAAGEAVFRGAKVNCAKCHTARGQGGKVGPDLTPVGTKYLRDHLVESILYPSRKLAQGFTPVAVVTKDERVFSGIVVHETPDKLTIAGSDGAPVDIPKPEIAERQAQTISIMPEGQENTMTDAEFVDVIAFLESLKQ